MLRIKVGNKMVALKQLSPDDMAAMRRTKSSEMSTWVQCNNHAQTIHTRKKVDLWYKEQHINVGKLGRKQQGMYQTLLKVHLEKRRIRKKKYIQQQEIVQQQLREKAAKEKHETTLKIKGLKKSKDQTDLPGVLSVIGEEEEGGEGEGQKGDSENKDKTTNDNTSVPKDTVESTKEEEKTTHDLSEEKGVQPDASTEKKNSKKARRKLGTVGRVDQNKLQTEVSTVKTVPVDIDAPVNTSGKANSTSEESSRLNARDNKPDSNETHDNIIDAVLEANKEALGADTKESDNKRKEKKVKAPVGMLPRVSLTTSYLTHGAPREQESPKLEVLYEDEDGPPKQEDNTGSGKKRRSSKRKQETEEKSASNTPDKLPDITLMRSSEVSKRKDSNVEAPMARKAKADKMIDITRFTRYTQSVRVPSNVHIPRISNVVRYHRNNNGSLVSSEVSLRPVEEDYKLPSTRQSYMIKKALKDEREKTKKSEKKLQEFYTKMEKEVTNRLPVMDHPIHSPSKEMFSGGHDEQNRVAFSASLLAQLRHNTVEGDVNDITNCKYIRFYDMMSPEERESYRKRRESSWGKHGIPDPNSWKSRSGDHTRAVAPVDLK